MYFLDKRIKAVHKNELCVNLEYLAKACDISLECWKKLVGKGFFTINQVDDGIK